MKQKRPNYTPTTLLGNLNAGAHGIIDWNLLLDAQGGPNHKNNFCQAPLMATASGGARA